MHETIVTRGGGVREPAIWPLACLATKDFLLLAVSTTTTSRMSPFLRIFRTSGFGEFRAVSTSNELHSSGEPWPEPTSLRPPPPPPDIECNANDDRPIRQAELD